MARKSIAAMLLEEELHNQHDNLFHPDEIVDQVYDRIALNDIPAQYRKDIKPYLKSVTMRILKTSKSNRFRCYSSINVDGTWYWKHVSAMDHADVRKVVTSFDLRIKALQARRDEWQEIATDMAARKRKTKTPIYAQTSIESVSLDWIPKQTKT